MVFEWKHLFSRSAVYQLKVEVGWASQSGFTGVWLVRQDGWSLTPGALCLCIMSWKLVK